MTGEGSNEQESATEDGPDDDPTTHPWTRTDPAWPVHDTQVLWETDFFQAGQDVVERPTGERAAYYWLKPGDAVVVVTFTDEDEIVLVEQYRPRWRRYSLGLPGGGVEDGEAPAAAAARELREETGFVAGTLSKLDAYILTPWARYTCHVFVARDLERTEPDRDDSEFIECETVPASTAIDRIRDRPGPANGISLTPLLLAREDGLL